MFSFHKPKIYRSNLGCCICKAKSSSSRFTDSKKYENEFERCFRIQEERSGEICNACVLLVKRWKKLSPENRITKHWHHVVDARAGPGTKLTGNRRLVSSSSSSLSNGSSNQDSSSTSQTSSKQRPTSGACRANDVLPLSSSQVSNQAGPSSTVGPKRTSSFSNKARAIDTNVSTFTFGESNFRRSYMTTDSSYSSSPSSSSFAKPQSALNSSAFESVIKRFRQRQQQQQLEAQRRLLNRQRRLQQQQQQQEGTQKPLASGRRQLPKQAIPVNADLDDQQQAVSEGANEQQVAAATVAAPQSKRLKRSSESIGSLTIDGLRVSTLLDGSLWRKEKICCGTIFRGLYNEVAVFPKLLKPCQCRVNKFKLEQQQQQQDGQESKSLKRGGDDDKLLIEREIASPTPRVTKSGSISSCDSNTSGTGSMEQSIEEQKLQQQQQLLLQQSGKYRTLVGSKQRRKSNLRPLEPNEGASATMAPNSSGTTAKVLGVKQFTTTSRATGGASVAGTKQSARLRPTAGNKRGRLGQTSVPPVPADTDSNSSSVFSSRGAGGNKSGSDSASQVAHSPASSSGASSTRLLLMAEDDDVDDDDDNAVDAMILDEDEDIESNTDASSSFESISGDVERKKSNASTVRAMS